MPLSLGLAEGAISTIGGLFTNPNDAKRIEEAKLLRDRAIAGDDLAFLKLRCLSGDDSVRAEACRTGAHPDACGATACGYATERARDFAKAMVAEVNARRAVGSVAGDVTRGAYALGTAAAPSSYFATLGVPSVSPLLLLAVVGGGAYLLLRKGR